MGLYSSDTLFIVLCDGSALALTDADPPTEREGDHHQRHTVTTTTTTTTPYPLQTAHILFLGMHERRLRRRSAILRLIEILDKDSSAYDLKLPESKQVLYYMRPSP